MIMLKPDEIRLLVEARDLLKTKLDNATPANNLWLQEGYQGVMAVLKHGAVDIS